MKPRLLTLLAFLAIASLAGSRLFAQEPRPFPAEEIPIAESATNCPPKVISKVEARRPTDSALQGLAVIVWVAFVVDPNGEPQRVRAFFSRNEGFEAAAVAAVKQWRFSPGIHEGHKVRTQMIVPIEFSAAAK